MSNQHSSIIYYYSITPLWNSQKSIPHVSVPTAHRDASGGERTSVIFKHHDGNILVLFFSIPVEDGVGRRMGIWHARVAMVTFEVPPYEPNLHCICDNDIETKKYGFILKIVNDF